MPVVEKTGNKKAVIVAPFEIEADHPRNSDVMIRSIGIHCKLRSALRSDRKVFMTDLLKRKGMQPAIPRDQAATLGAMPQLPGMRLVIDPGEMSYRIWDPLEADEALRIQLKQALMADDKYIISSTTEIRGVPATEGTLDKDQMKTLCREAKYLCDIGHCKFVGSGPVPEQEDIDELPGRYLRNPGIQTETQEPIYEDQYDAWKMKMREMNL